MISETSTLSAARLHHTGQVTLKANAKLAVCSCFLCGEEKQKQTERIQTHFNQFLN